MHSFIITGRSLAAFAALLLIGVAVASASAQRVPDTGGGTIYYYGPWQNATTGGSTAMWAMNADGSGKRQLGIGIWGPPSLTLYAEHRWFIEARAISGSYPDGSVRKEVFAYRDDFDFTLNNNSVTRVRLTDDDTLQPAEGSTAWVPGDKISFTARRWSSAEPGATIVEGGLYTASVLLGADGNMIGLAAPPTTPTIPFPLSSSAWPDLMSYSWDPTGMRVVYAATTGLWLADQLGNPPTRIFTGIVRYPQWSPDGTKIAFANPNFGISTIKPNGTSLKEIIKRTSAWFFDRPFWSRTGSHIICTGGQSGVTNNEVFRATASGTYLTNLTLTPDPFIEHPNGWR
jgi:hypothetical protein